MKIHILTDDKAKRRGFLAEHGLSIYIEHDGGPILFDTGQSDVYLKNAQRIGLDLTQTKAIVLSHGHYDHCGGMPFFPTDSPMPNIYVSIHAFEEKYAQNADGNTYREIGIPWSPKAYPVLEESLVYVGKSQTIFPDVTLWNNIPSTVHFEEVPVGLYVRNEHGKSCDRMSDEQMLVIETRHGLCIFLGCSHPGIINCLEYARKLFPGKPIDTLVAGMHLEHVHPLRLQMTMQSLLDMDIRRILPLHCTGIAALCEMTRYLGDRCRILYAGDSLTW
jgi:7,8-dihydropterin-6-yl-methyl-4-(beta-D-ribofuranosyl)aminobenzene 5'-phosphate synthase